MLIAEIQTFFMYSLSSINTGAMESPFEMVYGKKLDVSHLQVWGSLAYVHVQRDKRDGFGSHMSDWFLLGFQGEV